MPSDAASAAVLVATIEVYKNRLLTEPAALEYLGKRGFERGVIEAAHLGYAAGDELIPYLVWRGYSPGLARQLGLLRADGQEVFAGRIIVPELRQGFLFG